MPLAQAPRVGLRERQRARFTTRFPPLSSSQPGYRPERRGREMQDDSDRSSGDGRHPESCCRFEALLALSDERALTEAELVEYFQHEEGCPTGEHDVEHLERAMGLRPGAFKHGDPERGFPST